MLTTPMSDDFLDLQTSYGRCLRQGGFIRYFYELFMDSHPEVRELFAQTDFGRQDIALRRGISAAIAHAGGSNLARQTMETMAHVHSRDGRAPVSPELYGYWIDALIKAVEAFDPQYTPMLGQRWRTAMASTVGYFVQRF